MAALLNIVSLIALSASYDDALQFTSLSLTNVSLGTTVFATQRGYDPVGMVVSVNTTLANGTDNQVFCYDSLNRLVWAGSTGTPSCARTLTPGTLSAANYTATYAYDATNRITSGSLGTLTYGDSSHVHAATSSTSGETASYDTNGDMQCRAPTSATTCAGTPTGARLDYDAERRLTHWQNAESNPTTQAWYLYDGSGQRVEQYVSGGSGNHTYYLPGGVEEVTPSGSLIKYYSAGGMTLGLNTAHDASGISYLASDGLGSVSEALSPSGSTTGAVLYSPYGGVRYSSGTMPTSKGFTGQYSDAASSGLDYYGARYYDPALGQFTSADTANDGLNRYGYVKGNPETYNDPSGHRINCDTGDCGGRPGSKPAPPKPEPKSSGDQDISCADSDKPKICGQIVDEFQDYDTERTLLFLATSGSSIAWSILNWILRVGATLGDAFISWDLHSKGAGGYTDFGGLIHLNPDEITSAGYAQIAADLVHEGVESYYAIEHGVRTQASVQMDYLAEKYAGEFEFQHGLGYAASTSYKGGHYFGAYRLTLNQWVTTNDAKGYLSQPTIQPEAQFGVGIAPGYAFRGSAATFVGGGYIPELEADYGQLYNPIYPQHLPVG